MHFSIHKSSRDAAALAVVSAVFLPVTVQLVQAQTETVLYSFGSQSGDGNYPYGGLVFDKNGNLYGTTYNGGAYSGGTVFELTSTEEGWTETILWSFGNGTDGYEPYAGLVTDNEGNLYGTTYEGGAYSGGTVFELTPTEKGWAETILWSFGNEKDGAYPYAGLLFDEKGNLYGTTHQGGAGGDGTVYELTPTEGGWTETILHSFKYNGTDGFLPWSALIFGKKGRLYGTTLNGGAYNYGTVFELTPTKKGWTETILHSFEDNGTDGYEPEAGLVFDKKGNLYGTTLVGGADGDGTVFELTPTKQGWTETILWSLNPRNRPEGADPYAGLVFDKNGNLYGTTPDGGAYSYGTVFELTP